MPFDRLNVASIRKEDVWVYFPGSMLPILQSRVEKVVLSSEAENETRPIALSVGKIVG